MYIQKLLLASALPALFLVPTHLAFGQGFGRGDAATIRANIRPGGGDGKCTFEVQIDSVAEVEIRGDTGYLRTLSGSPATWRRLDCNGPLPRNPGNFRFQGVDGRGRQTLVRDPNSNGGTAVIRLEDPQNGREGYTGDIIWSGDSGGNYNGNGNWRGDNNGYSGNGGGGWNNGGWNRSGNGGWNGNGRSISIGDAMNICQNEVASESGASRGEVRVNGDDSNNDRGSFLINFQIRSRNSQINNARGTCRISRNGRIEDIRH